MNSIAISSEIFKIVFCHTSKHRTYRKTKKVASVTSEIFSVRMNSNDRPNDWEKFPVFEIRTAKKKIRTAPYKTLRWANKTNEFSLISKEDTVLFYSTK